MPRQALDDNSVSGARYQQAVFGEMDVPEIASCSLSRASGLAMTI